jgi:hypothetical protein
MAIYQVLSAHPRMQDAGDLIEMAGANCPCVICQGVICLGVISRKEILRKASAGRLFLVFYSIKNIIILCFVNLMNHARLQCQECGVLPRFSL